MACWCRLLLHLIVIAFDFARARAGSSSPAKIAMIAMTTRSSIRVKATFWRNRLFIALSDIVSARRVWQARTCRVQA